MSVLKDLYYGDLFLVDHTIKEGSEYDKLTHSAIQKEEILFATLSPEEKELYEAIGNIRADQRDIAEFENFVDGFRLGAQIMLEILTEPDKQLV